MLPLEETVKKLSFRREHLIFRLEERFCAACGVFFSYESSPNHTNRCRHFILRQALPAFLFWGFSVFSNLHQLVFPAAYAQRGSGLDGVHAVAAFYAL